VLLTNALVEGITSGHWKAGEKLPTEEELAEMTPFSLGTVQRALRNLAEQGIVVRQHGLGSFVAENDLRLEDPWHCRFLDDSGEGFLPIFSKAVNRERASGPGAWARHFPQAQDHVMRIDRVITVDEEFKVFTQFYADRRLLPALWERPLSKLNGVNFKKMIARESNVPITHVEHYVRTMAMDKEAAAILEIKPNTVGIFLQAVAHMGRNACVYYQEFFIPPTQRMLSIPADISAGMPARGQR
jgi:DNA-binding GntR family transcriptional regulator